jgi:magnesium transporter
MMEPRILDAVIDQIRHALEHDNLTSAVSIIESLRPPDQAEVFAGLDDADQIALLPELTPDDSADILERLDDEEVAELATTLTTDALIRIMDEMEPDEAADLLGDMPQERAQLVLSGLQDPEEIHPLLLHPDDSAGGLMTSEFLALRRRMTAADAINAIRAWKPDAEMIYYLFVIDAEGQLSGTLSLRELILADPAATLASIMDPEVVSVTVGVDQEECARIMTHYDLVALPVVDPDNRLLGVVTIDDVVDVLVDEATEDIQRMGGAQPLGRSYLETSTLMVVSKRIGWLLLLFVTGSLTASVIGLFQNELQSVITLSFFIPLLIGTGGNAGSQSTSTIIRALAVGDIELRDALQSLWHELSIGLVLGLGMAVVAYLRVATTDGASTSLALTVALSILAIVVWANGLGALLPLAATRVGIDPTVVSGPVMSTLVDATGLFIYFSIARVLLGL